MSERKVAYILSEQLAKVWSISKDKYYYELIIIYMQISSLLPSNLDRSLLVHHLVVSCGLLRTEAKNLSDAGSSVNTTVLVVKPSPATREQLQMFHDEDYLGKCQHLPPLDRVSVYLL